MITLLSTEISGWCGRKIRKAKEKPGGSTDTTLFVDGNHENFPRFDALLVEEWKGGRIHRIREHVIHLMRGEMFNLDGKNIFIFGGTRSHDIDGFTTDTALKRDYTTGILQSADPLL